MRLTFVRQALPLLGLVACGGDDKQAIDAAVVVDSPVIADAPPDAHMFKGYMADEGGEVRFEVGLFANGAASIRVTDFFFKSSGPVPYHPFPSMMGCTNTDKTQGIWPTSEANVPLSDQVYYTDFPVIISGGPTAYTALPNAADGTDAVGRQHSAGNYHYHFLGNTGMDAYTYATEKTSYTVTFTGSTDIPAQVFPNVIYMPANYDLISPAFTGTTISAGTDLAFTWTNPPQGNPPDHDVNDVIGFSGPQGSAVTCIYPKSGGFTVPGQYIDIVLAKYPTGGKYSRLEATHVPRELVDSTGPTGRRIDFLGIWCYTDAFAVQ